MLVLLKRLFMTAELLCFVSLHAQNSDLLMQYNSGSYSGMGGTGIASTGNISSADINPAVLRSSNNLSFSLSSNLKYYGYELNRISSDVGGEINNWNKTNFNLESAEISIRLSSRLKISAGLYQKINPELTNKRRAVTYSELFLQETTGSVYSAALSACLQINKNISAGLTYYNYFGEIASRIRGDNHGRDSEKWAELGNKMSGRNIRAGLLFIGGPWSGGVVFEAPFDMKVEAAKSISHDNAYAYLFPAYENTIWKQPMVIAAGISFSGLKRWQFEADFESRQYKSSNVQINLFEFGGKPEWSDVNIFRLGAKYLTRPDGIFPIMAGYALIPQLYYSNNSTGAGNTITGYQNKDRNLKHLFTAGTMYFYKSMSVDLSFTYSFVNWHRTLKAPQTLTDDYTEKSLTISFVFAYSLM